MRRVPTERSEEADTHRCAPRVDFRNPFSETRTERILFVTPYHVLDVRISPEARNGVGQRAVRVPIGVKCPGTETA